MPSPTRVPDSWSSLRALTSARIALGRAGGSLPTAEVLDFAVAHAAARDAVHAEIDADSLARTLAGLGVRPVWLSTRAPDRQTYLRRPDWGRSLDDAGAATLAALESCESDVAIILADGLSAPAVQQQGPALLRELLAMLAAAGLSLAPVCIVRQARVAVEDQIGMLLRARVAVILIGERPGLGSAQSLGAYLVFDPRPGRTDAQRNCVSNIRPGGLTAGAAAVTLCYLITQALQRRISGVELKDERPAAIAGSSSAPTALSDDELLPPDGWTPENHRRLLRFLREAGAPVGFTRQEPAPLAVFDWDNTCIVNDVGDAAFYYQARTLSLKLRESELDRIVPDRPAMNSQISFSPEKQELLENYRVLRERGLVGPTALDAPRRARRQRLYSDAALLRAWGIVHHRLLWFYQQVTAQDGSAAAYRWVARFYVNFTPGDVATLMSDVLARQLCNGTSRRCSAQVVHHPWPTDERRADGASVPQPIRIKYGLFESPRIRALMAALGRQGFDVRVVSATFQPVVAFMAARYGLPADRVIGMRLETRPDGSFADELLPPIPHGPGKVEAIRQRIGRDPLFVAGDSDGDADMLGLPSVRLRLVIQRPGQPRLAEMLRQASPESWLRETAEGAAAPRSDPVQVSEG